MGRAKESEIRSGSMLHSSSVMPRRSQISSRVTAGAFRFLRGADASSAKLRANARLRLLAAKPRRSTFCAAVKATNLFIRQQG